MATSDGTLLCIFSKSNCIIVDDFNQVVQQTIPIKTIWPGLPADMDSDLNAVCRDNIRGQFIFFKGNRCAVNKIHATSCVDGSFGDYFTVQAGGGANSNSYLICGSYENANLIYLHTYDKGVLKALIGPPLDLTTSHPMQVGNPVPISETGWMQMSHPTLGMGPSHEEVGCTEIFWPPSMGGTGQLTPAMLVQAPVSNEYQCTFIENTNFTALTKMWQGWDGSWRVDAATRVDASMIPQPTPDPGHPHHHHHHDPHHHHHHHAPHQGPGPVVSPNPLCNELPNIMKTVCSLTVLLHKALDACYPQSSWPTRPYPDGCAQWGGHGHHHGGCSCQETTRQPDGSVTH